MGEIEKEQEPFYFREGGASCNTKERPKSKGGNRDGEGPLNNHPEGGERDKIRLPRQEHGRGMPERDST